MVASVPFLPLSVSVVAKGADPSIANVLLSSPFSLPSVSINPSNSCSSLSSGVSASHTFLISHIFQKKALSLIDRILDYIQGGPKLRKWYGEPNVIRKDDQHEEVDNESSEIGVRDAVLVTNGECEIGQMIILLLIVKRIRVKVLVKDKKSFIDAFGTYAEALAGDPSKKFFLLKAMRGVRAIICPANDGFFSDVGQMKGVQHVILLSQLDAYKGAGVFQAIIYKKLRKLAERDEEVVITSRIPYTIVKAGLLQDVPGGKQGFCFDEGVASKGRLSKEDAARICVEALSEVPTKGLIFEVVNGDEKVDDWKGWFAAKIMNAEKER